MLEQLIGDSQALDRALAGEELSYKDGLELMDYDNLHLLGAVADSTRKKLVGDTVTFACILLHELHKCLCCKLSNVCILSKR